MSATTIERIRGFHAARVSEWGVEDSRSLGYTSDASQLARFKVIADLYDGRGSLLDVGCGTGQLLDYLRQRYGRFDYVGIDQQPEFIRRAQQTHHGQPHSRFMTGDFAECGLPASDVIVASGALSYRSDDCGYQMRCVDRLFAVARRSLIFNMLDSSRMFPGEVIVGHNVAATVNHCRTLTRRLTLLTDYLPFDFTLMLDKRASDAS